jgi:hypothetical protein
MPEDGPIKGSKEVAFRQHMQIKINVDTVMSVLFYCEKVVMETEHDKHYILVYRIEDSR